MSGERGAPAAQGLVATRAALAALVAGVTCSLTVQAVTALAAVLAAVAVGLGVACALLPLGRSPRGRSGPA